MLKDSISTKNRPSLLYTSELLENTNPRYENFDQRIFGIHEPSFYSESNFYEKYFI